MVESSGDHVNVACSHLMSDNAASLTGAHNSFQSNSEAAASSHRSLDASVTHQSKDLLLHNLNFTSTSDPYIRSGVGSTVETVVSEFVDDSLDVHSHLDGARRHTFDEPVHSYVSVTGKCHWF